MATQHHPAFDPNQLLPTLLRDTVRRKENVAPTRSRGWNGEIGQLCSYAQLEARTWVLRNRNTGKSGDALLKKLEEAKSAVESRWQTLRNMASAGHTLRGEAAALVENAPFLQIALQKVQAGLTSGEPLPEIQEVSSVTVPRAYAAATSFLRAVNYDFDEHAFEAYLAAIQGIAPLDMAELWHLKPLVELAIAEKIGAAAGQMDNLAATVAAQMLSRGQEAEMYEASAQADVAALTASLKVIDAAEWRTLFERSNVVEQVLSKDPCGAYARMDFESRENYRRAVRQLAKGSTHTEKEVAQAALEMARQLHTDADLRVRERKSHVGYYLIAEGKKQLAAQLGYGRGVPERLQQLIKRWPDFTYVLSIELLTFGLITAALFGAGLKVSGFLAVALFFLPAAECAVALVNQFATSLFPPKVLPKLDFSKGIPADCATMVVVPALLTNEAQMLRAVRDLEVRFLANRDAHLHFALLTDPPDSTRQFDEKDALAERSVHLIQNLNEKYAGEGRGSFFLFHRHRAFNPAQGIWMGWERKRGKLLDFNKLLLGTGDNFPVKTGNLSILRDIKYVITLDLDTQLPRDAARRLVGALAHPLNRAVIDPATNTVVDGYGILQPRVEISIQSANRSRLAAVLSADAGFDIYTRAISDVYQDLFGEGSFTGKGIYEVETFQKVLEHRFPCNAILSHDMIEGAYARAALVSDIEVVDDYPSHMSALSRRKHRWVRGDWQIIYWLLPRVPDFFGKMSLNPLSIISRWKILDNLRRSLTEIATFTMLVCAWLFFPGKALYWTLITLAAVALPTYAQFVISILRAGRSLVTRDYWKGLGADFAISQANLFMHVACLCHQSLVAVDAVVRTIVRMTVTHERLLEWETAAEAETRSQKKSPIEVYLELAPWLSFFIGLFLAVDRPGSFLVALPLLVLWGLSKPIVEWLSLPSRREQRRMSPKDEALLRHSALRTWRMFREFSTAEENWLVPDTVQEPASLIVHRISTTNLGLLLNARLAAMDLGFFTLPEFVADTDKTFDSIDRMPKENGQMYNWYETRTLEAVQPRFVSSVDNGNLVCCLWTVKQGCLGALSEPIFRTEQWQGVIDHLEALQEELHKADGAHALLGTVRELHGRAHEVRGRQTEWIEALPSCEREIVALDKRLSEEPSAHEAAWWSHELYLRVTHLQSLVYDFAPWLAPQFANLRENRKIKNVVESERLTLASLPHICAALEQKLGQLLETEDESSVETRSTLRLLRAAVTRTTCISASVTKKLQRLAERADALVKGLDFKALFEPKKKLLSIGFDAEEGRLSQACYAIFASEARAASFVAIAKGEIPQESWLAMERPYTKYAGRRILRSWTGTMFEYLMPLLWMKTYPNTALDETTRAAVHCQKKFAEEHGGIPWGMSEASCSKLSADGHYHYQAFGVHNLGINPERSEDLVVSPYSTFLALLVDPDGATENIRRMSELGLLGQYGFFEAADYTASRVGGDGKFEIVRCWLAHHQGMSLMAVANVLCNSSSQRRFHQESMVAATERLLHEKVSRTTQLEFPEEDTATEFGGGEVREPAGNGDVATLPVDMNTAA